MSSSLTASQQALDNLVDPARIRKSWNKHDEKWAKAADVSLKTLQRFWGRESIRRTNFIAICQALDIEDWKSVIDTSYVASPLVRTEFSAYDEIWVERGTLVNELRERLLRTCRVLILTGIAGIGKTALAERLIGELQEEWLKGDWSKLIRENFDDQYRSVDFGSTAERLLEKCGQLLTQDDRKDVERLRDLLINCLKENRYLVIVDSLENILQGNDEEGWGTFQDEIFVQFFKAMLAGDSFQSRIILTSQTLPTQIPQFGTRYQSFWYCQPLSGLSESQQLELFSRTGLDVESESSAKPYLQRIGAAYEGHPLALRVIAGEIDNKPFYGNVEAYWSRYSNEIEEVEKAIAEAKQGSTGSRDDPWQLDRFTKELRRNVRYRLEQTFKRLKSDAESAYILLCEASIYRCAVQEEFWLNHLLDIDTEQKVDVLNILKERYLVEEVVERNQYLLRQHNLIRSVALEQLRQLDDE